MYFQEIVFNLNKYWSDYGCIMITAYDIEMGAGTYHPATALHALQNDKWNAAYLQPSRRPSDARYGQNPNRLSKFHQYQVILKPSPSNIQDLCIATLSSLGISHKYHDIRFIEDDWENPTLAASGLGWELWCNGMEILQFTYMQQLGSVTCMPVIGELTYGLERIAMFLQSVETLHDIKWNKDYKYSDIYMQYEEEMSEYIFNLSNVDHLTRQFHALEIECNNLLKEKMLYPAYENTLKLAHLFNMLDARRVFGATERVAFIARIRNIFSACCKLIQK